MPTIGVKRDLLFDALGKKYSKFAGTRPRGTVDANVYPFPQLMTSSRSCASLLVSNWTRW